MFTCNSEIFGHGFLNFCVCKFYHQKKSRSNTFMWTTRTHAQKEQELKI